MGGPTTPWVWDSSLQKYVLLLGRILKGGIAIGWRTVCSWKSLATNAEELGGLDQNSAQADLLCW